MTNFYKVEQLTEQSTSSTSFVDIPGTTLTFATGSASEVWMVFASGVVRSNVSSEQPLEMRLVINGVEEDLWSHQNNSASTPNGAGFLVFDRITGTLAKKSVKLQFRALSGTCYGDNLRVVVAKVPDNADFQYYESDGSVSSTGSNLSIGSHSFTPSSSGNYYVLGSVKHREYPSGSTSQSWFEGSASHPDASGTHHSNARDPWNPSTCIWRETYDTSQQTVNIRFTSSGSGGSSSQHKYRKIMLFREDVWDANYSLSASQSTTTSSSFTVKNSITTNAYDNSQDYISFQTARISGNTTSTTARKSGELRIGGRAKVRTNHRINRDGSATQGYHHTIGLMDTYSGSTAITYENGFLSPDGSTIQCAESAIVVLRYTVPNIVQTHQIMM